MAARHTPLMAILALAIACAACKKESPTDAAAGPTLVTVTATDYAFEAPDTIAAGWTKFRLVNKGEQLHMALLIKLEGSRTLDDFLKAYGESFRTVRRSPRLEWAKRRGGPGAAEPQGQSNATQYLEPGSYAWICIMNVPDGIPHVFKAGMAKPFTVRGPTTPRTAPIASVVIRMVDYAFRISTPLTTGRHIIRVENVGVEPHEVGLLKLAPGKTMLDFQVWMRNPQGQPPANPVGGVSSLVTNSEAYFEVDLTSGDYLLVCFVTAPDGRPHAEHGMIQQVHIG
jgi:hypothetical protein